MSRLGVFLTVIVAMQFNMILKINARCCETVAQSMEHWA